MRWFENIDMKGRGLIKPDKSITSRFHKIKFEYSVDFQYRPK